MAERLPRPATAISDPLNAPLPVFRQAPPTAGENDLHELRVRIPVDLHRQLLSLKVLRGRSLAETVALALDIYFANHGKSAPHDEEAPNEARAPEP